MTAKPMTCFSCQHGELRGDLFNHGPDRSMYLHCSKDHDGTPKRQDECRDFTYEPGTDETERPA